MWQELQCKERPESAPERPQKKKANMKEQCHIDNIEDAEFIIDNMEQLPEIDDDTLATLEY